MPTGSARMSACRPPKGLSTRRQPSQARSRNTVALMLRAAQQLIERDGIDRVTTKQIAAAAGLSVGAVYAYFPNRESIAFQLGATWMERIRRTVADLHPSRSGIRDAISYLDRVIEACVQLYQDEPALGAVIDMMNAIPELREVGRKHDTEFVESVTDALAHYSPGARKRELEGVARSISIMTHAVLSESLVAKTCDSTLALRNLRLALYTLAVQILVPQPCSSDGK